MAEIDGVVEQAYREGDNIIAVCRGADGTYLQPCVIPVGSEKHKYLVREFNMSDPRKVENIPARFTVSEGTIENAERRKPVGAWAEAYMGIPEEHGYAPDGMIDFNS